jgi:protein-disulfide isomerase
MKGGKLFAAVAVGVAVLLFAALAHFYGGSGAGAAAQSETLVRPHSPVKGEASAPVTVVEFLDPECESCRAMHPIVKQLASEYAERVRWVVRYLPLHANSLLAAALLEEAREAGKFEEALDALFENQPSWGDHQNPKPELMAEYLQALGLPAKMWDTEALIAEHRWKVEQDSADGKSLGVRGTPTFFVNGSELPELGYRPLKRAIDDALAAAG